jgi:hypothetical protein
MSTTPARRSPDPDLPELAALETEVDAARWRRDVWAWIVVVHADRLAAKGKLHVAAALDFAPAPGQGPLLGHAHEDNARAPLSPGPVRLHHLILPCPLLELYPGDPVPRTPRPEPSLEPIRDLSEHGRRRYGRSPGVAQECHDPAFCQQAGGHSH